MAVLNHNRLMGYVVLAAAFEAMIERLEDLELAGLARARADGTPVPVSLDDLYLPCALKEWERLGAHGARAVEEETARASGAAQGSGPCPVRHAEPLQDQTALRAGYRLVYRVEDERAVVAVVAEGKRERSAAYEKAKPPGVNGLPILRKMAGFKREPKKGVRAISARQEAELSPHSNLLVARKYQ